MPDDFLPPNISCLIDEVLPTHRVHLLSGVSDAGKTRWLIPAMLAWEKGLPVLGRASHPGPWAYVIGDRTMREAEDTMASMGIDIRTVRCIPSFGGDRKTINQVLTEAQRMKPKPRLLVWEGFQDVCGEKKRDVQDLLSTMAGHCEDQIGFPDGLTILGVVESPKLKPAERYPNPRHRVSGVSAWGYHSSTILLLEGLEGDPSLLRPERVLWVCVKNGPRRQLLARFNETGQLVVVGDPVPRKKSKREAVTLVLQATEK